MMCGVWIELDLLRIGFTSKWGGVINNTTSKKDVIFK
jgi:hypothetical protein